MPLHEMSLPPMHPHILMALMVRESDVDDSQGDLASKGPISIHSLYPQLLRGDPFLHPAGCLYGYTLILSSILLGLFAGTP